MPTVGFSYAACGDPFCTLDICTGPHHATKKPWYMTQKPLLDPDKEVSPPIELLKMDGWVLEKDREEDTESSLYQYCPSMQWKKLMCITEIRAGYCESCAETIPEEMVGAYTMHNWNMLQKYDADMKKYGQQPYDPVGTEAPNIQVFR